jgi:hypothetical protein
MNTVLVTPFLARLEFPTPEIVTLFFKIDYTVYWRLVLPTLRFFTIKIFRFLLTFKKIT